MQSSEFGRANNYAARLFSSRMRSEKEIRDKLVLKKYSAEICDKVIEYFKNIGLINDVEFASSWIKSRLKKPLAVAAVKIELQRKGIDKEIIQGLLADKENIESQNSNLKKFAEQRFLKLKNSLKEPQKIKDKLFMSLLRRGFSSEQVIEVINELFIS